MILSDYDIARYVETGRITLTPYDPAALGTNSYDLHLSPNFAVYEHEYLDCKQSNPVVHFRIPDSGYELLPGILYLSSTIERTDCIDLVPCIEGKSSLARLGMDVHRTAGFGDSGFDGHWTLEISVLHPLRIYPGIPVAQIYWQILSSSPVVPYNKKQSAKYNNQPGFPVPSMMHKNFE